jgi:bidirectional [NiFe] hydrogenase diaphorase subunit
VELTDLLEIAATEREEQTAVRLRCCVAAGCVSARSEAVLKRLQELLQQAGLADRVRVAGVGCLRLCGEGPLVQVDPEGVG